MALKGLTHPVTSALPAKPAKIAQCISGFDHNLARTGEVNCREGFAGTNGNNTCCGTLARWD